MISPNLSPARPGIRRTALLAFGCALSLALAHAPALGAADTAALRPLADMAPDLPLTPTFAKGDPGDNGPYTLSLLNTSKDSLKVTGKVLLSVYVHAESKARSIPEHVIDPGQVWTIADLAAGDKVTITADGYAPLELTVP
jgi:hypothetical protein